MFHKWFTPKKDLTASDIDRGVNMLLAEGVSAWIMMYLTMGPFLIAFALVLGASNTVIGLLAAIGPFAQILQIPSVYLVDAFRRRKLLVTVTAFVSRSAWIGIAAAPFILPKPWVIPAFLFLLFLFFAGGALVGCGFNSWVRDLVPEKILSSLLGQRLAMATALGVVLMLSSGFAVDWWKANMANEVTIYSIIFIIGTFFGLISVFFLFKTPEPEMQLLEHKGFFHSIMEPVHDKGFRQLLIFMGWWSFALNFAGPFFAVYMIQRLGFSMSWVLGLTVLSQVINIFFFRMWGIIADRISNKKVLTFTGVLLVGSFLIWPFTTMPERYAMTIPILIFIHILGGISTAGVNLCGGSMALKLAPYGKGGNYLAMNGLVTGIAATISPIVAGFIADWASKESLSLTISLKSLEQLHPDYQFTTVHIQGLDFIFILAFFLGLYALHRLLSVEEHGEVKEADVHRELFQEMRRMRRQMSTTAGIRQLLAMPTYAMEHQEEHEAEASAK